MRIGFLSDLHTDYNHLHHFETIIPRLIRLKRLDVLCILGDTATGAEDSLAFYQALQRRMAIPLRILPGNHDIFVRHAAWKTVEEVQHQSTEAYFKLLHHPTLSLYLNPIVTPHWLVVGISGWYDYSFVAGDPDKLARHLVSKYIWPDQMMINRRQIDAARDRQWVDNDLERLTELFSRPEAQNRKRLVAMHFLPTRRLIERKHYLLYRHFIVQLGSTRYQQFFETHQVAVSISGHSHMPIQCDAGGVHYENVSLGYDFQWADASDALGELERILYVLEDD
ncbi:MAG: metallophosphoesterase [Sporolactobacillus sp.]